MKNRINCDSNHVKIIFCQITYYVIDKTLHSDTNVKLTTSQHLKLKCFQTYAKVVFRYEIALCFLFRNIRLIFVK